MLNAEAYMLFYKKGVGLAKVTQDDSSSVRPLSANGELRDLNCFAALWDVEVSRGLCGEL